MAKFELHIGGNKYNKAYIDDFNCKSQISTDASSVNYSVIPSTGSANMKDVDDAITNDIKSGKLQYANAKTNVLLNGGAIQELQTSDSNYNNVDKTLSINFSDRLSALDSVTYSGMELRDYSMSAYEMLDDVVGSYYGYVKNCPINWLYNLRFIDSSANENIVSTDSNSFSVKITKNSSTTAVETTISPDLFILYTPIKVVPNKRYTISYALNVMAYTGSPITLGVYDTIKKVDNRGRNGLYDPLVKNSFAANTTGTTREAGTLEFTTKNCEVYLAFNFGGIDAGQSTSIEMFAVGSFSIDGNATLYDSCQLTKMSVQLNDTKHTPSISTKKIYDMLQSTIIEYPYLESGTYRSTLEKFCTLAQITMRLDESGSLMFYDARPIYKGEKIYEIPKYNQTKNLTKNLLLNNKYDGVRISQTTPALGDVDDILLFNYTLTADDIKNDADITKGAILKGDTQKELLAIPCFSGKARIAEHQTTNDVSLDIVSIDRLSVKSSGKHTSGYFTDSTYDSLEKYYEDEEISWIEPILQTGYTTPPSWYNEVKEELAGYNTTSGSAGKNKSWKFEHITYGGMYWWTYNENYDPSDVYESYNVDELTISAYGAARANSETIDRSTENIASASAIAEVPTNELLQKESVVVDIRNNILDDYAEGIETGTVRLFCGTKAGYLQGEIIQPNDIVKFGDDNNLWRVTSRTFDYKGAPTVSLELQAQRYWHNDENLLNTPITVNISDGSFTTSGTVTGSIDLGIKQKSKRPIACSFTAVYSNDSEYQYSVLINNTKNVAGYITAFNRCSCRVTFEDGKIVYSADEKIYRRNPYYWKSLTVDKITEFY